MSTFIIHASGASSASLSPSNSEGGWDFCSPTLSPCRMKYTRDLDPVSIPAAELSEAVAFRNMQHGSSSMSLPSQFKNKSGPWDLCSLSGDDAFVRVEENEFTDSSESEDEGEPVYVAGLEKLITTLERCSLTLSAPPKLEERPSPELRLSDVSPLSAPRSSYRRLACHTWSDTVSRFEEVSAKKARTLPTAATSQSNVTEEKTFRWETEAQAKMTPVIRRSIKRIRLIQES